MSHAVVAGQDEFYALVESVGTGFLSKKVSSLRVEVLAGTVQRGDPIDLVRADGETVRVSARSISDDATLVYLANDAPLKDELGSVSAAHSPGLVAPRLPSEEEEPGTQYLLEAVRNARLRDFPEGPPSPQSAVPHWLQGTLRQRFRGMPDEAVVLVVRKPLKRLSERISGHLEILNVFEIAAEHLDAIGLQEDADRVRLAGARALKGKRLDPAMRALASMAASGAMAGPIAASTPTTVRGIGWVLGLEMGEGFAVGYQSGMGIQGAAIEHDLISHGRAVAVGRCGACGNVAKLTLGTSKWTSSPEPQCPHDGRKVDDPLVLVPSDADAAEQVMRQTTAVR